jgi:two-component system, NtrC family, nitrogen regulation sensor histidine kinase NtrY
MAASGRIRRRLALAIVLTALIPLLFGIYLANRAVRRTSDRLYQPEFGARLDQTLDLYKELAHAVKASMRHEANAIAADAALRHAAGEGDAALVKRELARLFPRYPNLVSLGVKDARGKKLATVDRGRPFDPKRENKLEVTLPLAEADPIREAVDREEREAAEEEAEEGEEETDEGSGVPRLVAIFAADNARFEQRNELSEFVDAYRKIEQDRDSIASADVYAVAALLGITILGAIGVGTLLARGVSSRIGELAEATHRVAAGDLTTRVPEDGNDEIADLARAFNRMLGEVETSRARIEYLQRIGAWQEMARRLAHEIKNPLTPIQLAVQEMHRRYRGEDVDYRKLVDTTLEIVEDEVGTLRRLVSEFSDFARLPQADLEQADLAEFLREQAARLTLLEEERGDALEPLAGEGDSFPPPQVELDLPRAPAPAYIDRQMLRRALINLVRNAAQALGAERKDGKVQVRLSQDGDYWIIDIDDNGPGIPADMRAVVFDPYVTTKTDGTGLGLAIVKKIVVEHGGSITADASPLGGARMRVRLPRAGSRAGSAALESRDWQPPSSRRSGLPEAG